MAVIETWFNQERTQPVKVRYLDGNVFSMDNNGNLIGVEVFENGEPFSLSGTVSASVIRSDGTTVAVTGSLSGNKCFVTLPQSCYSVPGVLSVVIKLTTGTTVTTLCAVVANVYRSSTDTVVDPGTIIPSVENLIAAIEAAVASIPADYSDLWTSLAPEFSTGTAYTKGQYVTYNGHLYRFTSNHSAGSWNNGHATQTSIGTDIADSVAGFPALNNLIMNRMVRFPNFSSGALYALDISYNSTQDQYTVTALKAFSLVGYSMTDNLVRIGYNTSSLDYPMPASFSSATNMGYSFGFLCFDLSDTTTTTWQIVKYNVFVSNQNLVPICVLYRGMGYFYDDNLKTLFKTSITDVDFLNKENFRIIQTAFYYNGICNATALIAGRANYSPSEYKITFTGAILGPVAPVGSFDQSIRYDDVVVDWSEEEHPEYVRYIYYDMQAKQMVAYCETIMTADAKFEQRLRKNLLALVCVVYQGTFVYTCGACTPGKWFVNGNDIYAGSSDAFKADLFNAFKKVGVVGDSLSVGYMYNKQTEVATSRMLSYSWVKKVMNDAGVPWLNLGTSGQSVLTWCSNATYGKVQAEASGNKCQMYIIGLGENDQSNSARGVPLGTPEDIVDNYQTVATTYYGGYARIIQILKHINPDCKIFCLTNPRTGGNARAEYNVAVRYIAGTYYTPNDNVFLVDLANDDGTLFNGGTFLPTDAATITGGHYSAVGYSRIATIMENAIMKAIQANQTHFIDVAYIPYDTTDPTPNTMTE